MDARKYKNNRSGSRQTNHFWSDRFFSSNAVFWSDGGVEGVNGPQNTGGRFLLDRIASCGFGFGASNGGRQADPAVWREA